MGHGLFTIFLHLSGPRCQEGRESLMQSGNKDTGRLQGRVQGGAAGQETFTVEVTYMNWIQVAGSQLPGFIHRLQFLTFRLPQNLSEIRTSFSHPTLPRQMIFAPTSHTDSDFSPSGN